MPEDRYFGLSADLSNQPGGTNYAIFGSTNSETNGASGNLNQNTLLANYLVANGSAANPEALYLISSGGNDISLVRITTVGRSTDKNDV